MDSRKKIVGLRAQHRELEVALEKEKKIPYGNDEALRRLKQEKLRIKDRIEALRSAEG